MEFVYTHCPQYFYPDFGKISYVPNVAFRRYIGPCETAVSSFFNGTDPQNNTGTLKQNIIYAGNIIKCISVLQFVNIYTKISIENCMNKIQTYSYTS